MIKTSQPVDRYAGERLDPSVIEVGDKVAWLYSGRARGAEAQLAKVVRLTRTQIIVETLIGHEYRFERATGKMRAEWGTYLIDPADPRVIRARALVIARRAVEKIQATPNVSLFKDIDSANRHLEMLRGIVNDALDRMARILTNQEVPESKENGS